MSISRILPVVALLAIAALLQPSRLDAQTASADAVLTGTVTDATGAAVPEVTLDLFGPSRRTIRSDANGKFAVEGLRPGEYRIVAQRTGFAVAERRVTLDAGARQELALPLAVGDVAEFVEAVSKSREEAIRAPFLASAVSGEEIRRTGAATFEEALRTVPGLQHGTQGNAFTRISTRGLRDTADVLVLLDGVPFRQLNGSADLTMLPVPALT